jgi:MFS family permease
VSAPGYRDLLAHPVARRLLITQTISEAGDFVGLSALVLLAYGRSGSVVGSAGVFAAGTLPALTVGTLLSGWLDRPGRRTALVVLALVGAAVTGTVGAVPQLLVALLAAAVLGATRTASVSISMAVVVEKVPEELRGCYFGLMTAVNQGAQAVGFLVGATATLEVGPRPALLFDAGTFVVAAVVLSGLPAIPPRRRDRRPPPTAGIRTVLGSPVLSLVAPAVWVSSLVMVFPEAVAAGITSRSPALPLLMASWTIGLMCSSLVLSGAGPLRTVRGQLSVALLMGIAFSIGAAVLAAGGGAWGLIPVNFVLGVISVWIVGVRTTFARYTPPERMAQVEATMLSSINLGTGLGALALASVAAASGADVSYAIAAVLVTAGAGGGLYRAHAAGVLRQAAEAGSPTVA